jgi:SAM-dependent methyltransferase
VTIELGDNCVACGSGRAGDRHIVPEAMDRTGESFAYRECGACSTLQIETVPADLGDYYKQDSYYSFAGPPPKFRRGWLRVPPVRLALRLNTELYLRTGLGKGMPWVKAAGLRPDDRILDIGCGGGTLLFMLHVFGYRHLRGADPFLDATRELLPGVSLLKATHQELDGRFEWVMLHHTFEHVADPRALLASVRRVLASDGRVLIRIPVAGTWAWRHYKTDWVSLDAPRHMVLYTIDGFRRIIEDCGFQLERVFYDSQNFQFWGSELVRTGEKHGKADPARHFTAAQLTEWSAESERLNQALDGDQACFILKLP